MRLSRVLPLILLLCCLSVLQSVAGGNEKQASKKGENTSFAQSGTFSSKDNHACTWKITGGQSVSLAVSCNTQNNQSYECTYEGEPQRCPSYSTKAKQYWKQILGKIKKKRTACEEKSLKSRICKKGPAGDSQLRLVQTVPNSLEAKGKGKAKGRGRKGEEEQAQEPGSIAFPENVAPGHEKGGRARKQKSSGKSNGSPDMLVPPPTRDLQTTSREANDEIAEPSEDLTKEYCAEKWHSLCSFMVNFFNG